MGKLPPIERDLGKRGLITPIPPLPQIVLPCAIGGVMLTLGVVDLAIDLSGDPALLTAWYSAQATLPILSQWQRYVLPLLLVALVLKLCMITMPGFRNGKVGCTIGLAPVLILPVVIVMTVRAKKLLEATNFRPSIEDVAQITIWHTIRVGLALLMMATGVSEFGLKLHSASASLVHPDDFKVRLDADKQD